MMITATQNPKIRWVRSLQVRGRVRREEGRRVRHLHLRHLNPFPRNLGEVLQRYKKVVVAEMNMGQLLMVLRGKFLVDAVGLNKVQGKPFQQAEIEAKIEEMLK